MPPLKIISIAFSGGSFAIEYADNTDPHSTLYVESGSTVQEVLDKFPLPIRDEAIKMLKKLIESVPPL